MSAAFDGRRMTVEHRERLRAAVSDAKRRQLENELGPRNGKAGVGAGTPFRSLLKELPEMIADAAERGVPVHVVFKEPLTPSAQRLLSTLGVTWAVKPTRTPPR